MQLGEQENSRESNNNGKEAKKREIAPPPKAAKKPLKGKKSPQKKELVSCHRKIKLKKTRVALWEERGQPAYRKRTFTRGASPLLVGATRSETETWGWVWVKRTHGCLPPRNERTYLRPSTPVKRLVVRSHNKTRPRKQGDQEGGRPKTSQR